MTLESAKYKCIRCKDEIKDSDSVLVLKEMLTVKNKLYDLCSKCTKDFYTFINEITTQRQNESSH